MADKNLHDIKIDELDSPKKTPLKNILTLLALLFIILVISVVITKLILSTNDGKDIENNSSITTPATEVTEEVNKSIEVKSIAAVPVLNSTIPDRNLTSVTKKALRTHTPVKTVKEAKTYKTPKAHTAVKDSTHKKEYIDKVVTKKHVPAKKKASYLGAHLKTLTNSYYIKVGSFKNTTAIIGKIKKSNFNYSVQKLDNDSQLSRVYVGPFFSQNQAEKNLKKVQQSIAKSAYVQKVKP